MAELPDLAPLLISICTSDWNIVKMHMRSFFPEERHMIPGFVSYLEGIHQCSRVQIVNIFT
jgi:hypothetical protein